MSRVSHNGELSQVRRHVLDAGLQLFSRKGFAATSVREIVRQAGVTKPVLYYHFGSKQGLLRALVDDAFAEYEQRVRQELEKAADAREAIVRLVQICFELSRGRPEMAAFMYLTIFGSEADSAGLDVREPARRNRALVESVVSRCVDEGLIAATNAETAGLLLSGLVNIHVMAFLKGNVPRLDREVAVEAVDLYLSGACQRHVDAGDRQSGGG